MEQLKIKQSEKRKITSVANGIGGAFLILFGISVLMPLLATLFVPEEIIINDGFLWTEQILFSSICFTVPFLIMAPVMRVKPSTMVSYAKPEKGTMLPMVLGGVAMCYVANYLGSIFSFFLEVIGLKNIESSLSGDPNKSWVLTVLSVIVSACLPAFVEEFALRGFVLGSLRRFGDRFSIIISALLFGLMHETVSQIPFAFIVGLVLGFAVCRTGSIWTAVIIHLINNLLACIIETVGSLASQTTAELIGTVIFIITLSMSAVAIYISRGKSIFTLPDEAESVLTLKEKCAAFFCSATIIIMIARIAISMIIESILY